MILATTCPACGHNSWIKHLNCIDHTVSHETFTIERCLACGLLATSPRPSNDELPTYYQSEDYISHTDKASSAIDRLYKLARTFTLKWKEQLIKKYSAKGCLLDYGCGTGDFLLHCSKRNWQPFGVEPATTPRTIASAKLGPGIYPTIKDVLKSRFDAITLWHVLEHVPDLRTLVDQLQLMLKEDGTLFIAVPNYKSHDGEHYQSNWAGYDVPRHLWHFTPDSMKTLISKSPLEIIAVHPMKLDSYYVSLLSEKYANNGRANVYSFVKAFVLGLRSNILARKTGHYSSLIYVIKKAHA
jgi:2-polyprenyl-3-methyl-5-hydroxy-6-metoxy-1,4-benzoquinol methylase